MARPKSSEKRDAILSAAVAIIAARGLGAPTALIAKEAGISNGALFTYFETKSDLLNELYLKLKADMASATTSDLPLNASMQDQLRHLWDCWLRWAMAHPNERRALAHLSVSHEVTDQSRKMASQSYAGVEHLLDRSRASGPMRDAPLTFVASLVMSIVDATIDYISSDPAKSKQHSAAGFDALWRILS